LRMRHQAAAVRQPSFEFLEAPKQIGHWGVPYRFCSAARSSSETRRIATEGTWPETGGGISDFFDPPTWQSTANVPNSLNPGARKGRGIPDLCAVAAPGLQIAIGGQMDTGGGTSQVAPFLAGLIARLNSETHRRAGFLNPLLYRLGNTALFRDMNDGMNNAYTFVEADGTRRVSPGYTSGPGWDAYTGWGCIDGSELLKALSQHQGYCGAD
jgi:kumamolisin